MTPGRASSPTLCSARRLSTRRIRASFPRSPRARMSRGSTATIAAAMRDAGLGFADLDGVAATAGPGLIGGVMVGLVAGKAIALAHDKPLIAVNHLEGHALSPRLADRRRDFSLPAAAGRRAVTASSSPCWMSVFIAASAPPSTMRSAKRSTRSRSCSTSDSRAARWSRKPRKIRQFQALFAAAPDARP